MGKRLLLIGDLGSIHIYNYITNILSKTDFEITAYHTASITAIRSDYNELYKRRGIKIIGGHNIKQDGKIKFVWSFAKALFRLGRFDYLHLHYVSHYICPILYLYKYKFKHSILTYWGSDLLRSTRIKRALTKPMVKHSDKLTFITTDMMKTFNNTFGKDFDHKCEVLDFGNLFFGKIDILKANYSKEKIPHPSNWELAPNKKIVTVGYCGRPEMRQYETIQTLAQLPTEYLNNIQFIIPAWGISQKLKQNIATLCEQHFLEYRIFDHFMGPDEVVRLRCLTDIFVHAQTSDALSSAMLEHLYAGSIVLNGSWLNYSCLTDNNIKYLTFNDFGELLSCMADALSNIGDYQAEAEKNRDKVAELASWDAWAEKWLNLYK